MNGVEPTGLRFAIPDEEAFRGSLGRPAGIQSSNMDGTVLNSDVRLFEREELEMEIKQGLRRPRQHLDPA